MTYYFGFRELGQRRKANPFERIGNLEKAADGLPLDNVWRSSNVADLSRLRPIDE
jgi:hypothetical protein